MKEQAEVIDPGFSIADGEHVSYLYDGEFLSFQFTDWTEETIVVRCSSVIGFKYQWATGECLADERFDSTHLIHNSRWLLEHQKQGEGSKDQGWRHFKLNFNAAGVMEVLCKKMEII